MPGVTSSTTNTTMPSNTSIISQNFVSVLLNIKNIKLDDAIFSDPAFNNLHDQNISLKPDGTEGRPNPFAQFGNDNPAQTLNIIPVTPPVTPPIIIPITPPKAKTTTP